MNPVRFLFTTYALLFAQIESVAAEEMKLSFQSIQEDISLNKGDIVDATYSCQSPATCSIDLTIGEEAAARLSRFFTDNTGSRAQIVLNGIVLMAPTQIREPVGGTSLFIHGLTEERAQQAIQSLVLE